MEHTDKNPLQNVIAVIPARFSSTRLPGKMLLPLNGKPLILHTLERAKAAKNVSRVIVATDDERILRAVRENSGEAILTAENHQSGSDRIAEVAETLPENSVVVNVQGDEPLISPLTIEKAVEAILSDAQADVVTICEKISDWRDVLNPNVVKVLTGENDFAVYFSRSPIPFPRAAVLKHGSLEKALREEIDLISNFRKHTGLYVYRREFLLKFTGLPQSKLEKLESLEQLRALENGARIKVVEVSESSTGVDTAEDFARVREILEAMPVNYRAGRVEDAPAIARVHVESWRKSFAGIVPQEFLDNMSVEKRTRAFEQRFAENDYKIFVAETSADGIVGFADFGRARDENSPHQIELYAIYLLPEYQRRGIAGKLFRLCQREMVAGGVNSMYLNALEISPYRTFYDKMGGRKIGEGRYDLAGMEHKTWIYGWDDLRKTLGEKYD